MALPVPAEEPRQHPLRISVFLNLSTGDLPAGSRIDNWSEHGLDEDGRFTLPEKLSDQRNPSLCDIFFGLSAMERAGTGLLDVGSLMTTSGGGASEEQHRSVGNPVNAVLLNEQTLFSHQRKQCVPSDRGPLQFPAVLLHH